MPVFPLTLRVSLQFRGRLALMFNSQGKQQQCARANVTSSAVESGDSEQLSHNSRRRQNKIDAQAAEIAQMKTELNKALTRKSTTEKLVQPR